LSETRFSTAIHDKSQGEVVTEYGMPQANIDKLQRVQNILARVVVGAIEHSSRFTLVTCWSSYYLQTASHELENT